MVLANKNKPILLLGDSDASSSLVSYWTRMDARNRQLGLERYDWGDVQSHPLMLSLVHLPFGSMANRLLRFPEWCAPMIWRRAIGLRKQLVPSVFYHLGMTYLAQERLDFFPGDCSSEEIAKQALAARVAAEHVCWKHPYRHHAAPLQSSAVSRDMPPSCAHHTARLGQMLVETGKYHQRNDLIDAGGSAAEALLKYHYWQCYDDGTCTVSYYPHTRDEVINTAADVVALFVALPKSHRSPQMQSALDGLLQMILREQQPNGSWFYCTKRYYARSTASRFIDGHHTAMVIRTLALVLAAKSDRTDGYEAIRKALENGVQFYADHFFLADGKARYFPDRKRETNVVGYAEAISAFCTCLQLSDAVSFESRRRMERLVPQIMKQALDRFLNRRTFDVACCRFLGRPYQIQSARWGSAPLMHAITDFLSVFGSTGDGSWTNHQRILRQTAARPYAKRSDWPTTAGRN